MQCTFRHWQHSSLHRQHTEHKRYSGHNIVVHCFTLCSSPVMPRSRQHPPPSRRRILYYLIQGVLLLLLGIAVAVNLHVLASPGDDNELTTLSASNSDSARPHSPVIGTAPGVLPRKDMNRTVGNADNPAVATGGTQPATVDALNDPRHAPLAFTPVKRIRRRARTTVTDSSPIRSVDAPVLPTAASQSVPVSSMTAFIAAGGRLPILLVTSNRTDVLKRTLSSLLSVRDVHREAVYVIQDGTAPETADIVRSFGLRLHQKQPVEPSVLRGSKQDIGAQKIASHYKYALEFMFDSVTDVRGRESSQPAVVC